MNDIPVAMITPEAMTYLVQHLRERYEVHQRFRQLRLYGSATYTLNGRRRTQFDSNGTWERIARWMVGHKLNIERSMQTRFRLAASRFDSVFPNTIALDKYLADYQDACRTLEEETICDFRNERERFFVYYNTVAQELPRKKGGPTQQTPRRALEKSLLDSQLQISDLARYCLAVANQLPWIAARFRSRAMDQFLLTPGLYSRFWIDENGVEWIPKKFRDKAFAITGGFDDGDA